MFFYIYTPSFDQALACNLPSPIPAWKVAVQGVWPKGRRFQPEQAWKVHVHLAWLHFFWPYSFWL